MTVAVHARAPTSTKRGGSRATSASARTGHCSRRGCWRDPALFGPAPQRPAETRLSQDARHSADRLHSDRPRLRHGGGRLRQRPDLQAHMQPRLVASGAYRPELVRVRGGRVAARLDPGRAQPPAGRVLQGQPLDEESDGRDQGPPLLEARRYRLRGDRARRVEGPHALEHRRGRLDDHPAARPQPLHRAQPHLQPQAEGGLPGDEAR